ncbi:hypothetical protein X742_34490 [Mesorhizobium sp. LNHC232B00]|nr:hypothetical protein X742_34490 [Mesorhizobium sp. LNHC232B00]
MRGRSWIRKKRLAEAQMLREQIVRLETELFTQRGTAKPRRLTEFGYHLHSSKSRLERLERCISALQSADRRREEHRPQQV